MGNGRNCPHVLEMKQSMGKPKLYAEEDEADDNQMYHNTVIYFERLKIV